ncbi:MAG: hypothetical protein RL088_2240 [Verrucomicrobiota bacterium]|jgi:polysaccharide export outer membrane protein
MLNLLKTNRILSSVFAALLLAHPNLVIAQDEQKAPVAAEVAAAAADPGKPVNFRAPNATLKSSDSGLEAGGTPIAGGSDLESLIDRRDSLEAEIRYSQNRIEADRKRAQVHQSLNQAEEAERLLTQIRDAEARIRANRAQLAQIEDEVNRLQSNTSERGQGLTMGEEVILPGENLEVIVNEDAGFNNRYVVRRGGYIIMPGIGRVSVAGKTVTQAERDISHALRQTQLKRATVTVERFQGVSDEPGAVIYLAGEFRNPRPFKIPAGTSPTLISVMLSSGGWTDRADLTRVKIMRVARNKPVADEVNVKRILDGNIGAGGLGADITLTEGDVIVLPSGSLNLVYVTGRVKRPGSYRITEGEKLTVYGAVLQSGGFDHFASLSRIHILRAMPDGTKAKIPVDIKEVQRGRKPDVILQANDIVVVPEKWFSW